jgi:hypothetical protein
MSSPPVGGLAKVTEFIEAFFGEVGEGRVEIYNEFSLQHELGIYLRKEMVPPYKVQFERPVDFFGLRRGDLLKTEIDISLFASDQAERAAIETKFPRNGRYPETMFDFCKDVAFLEELVRSGFHTGLLVVAADDALFWAGGRQDGIYAPFRARGTLHGRIDKPTGGKGESVAISGSYNVRWLTAGDSLMFFVIHTVGLDARAALR